MKIDFLVEWSTAVKDFVGLPRPYAKYKEVVGSPIKLSSKTPIPWQSIPNVQDNNIRLFQRHEDSVYRNNLCPYCGVAFLQDEEVIRWTTIDKPLTRTGQRVFSDVHPFHKECMRQSRIFCPHMRNTKDNEFELGPFSILRNHADIQINQFITK